MNVASIRLRPVVSLALVAVATPAVLAQAFYGMPIGVKTDTAQHPQIVAAGDYDGDGLPDAAAIGYESGSFWFITLLHGRGDGSLAATNTSFPVSFTTVSALAADLDDDGDSDLLLGSSIAAVGTKTYLGDGAGTLAYASSFAVGPLLRSGDCNGDGLLDLVTAGQPAGAVTTMIGHGDGSFDLHSATPDAPAVQLAVADFDEDGRTDAASSGTPSSGPRIVTIFRAAADGSLGKSLSLEVTGGQVDCLLAGDFNDDGHSDLVDDIWVFINAQTGFGHKLQVLLGDGSATQFTAGASFVSGDSGAGAVVADTDADGELDLAYPSSSSVAGWVRVARGLGDGSFAPPVIHEVGAGHLSLCVTDLDLDGRSDLLCACADTPGVISLMGHDDGSLGDPLSATPAIVSLAVECGDLDGDGDADVVSQTSSTTYSYLGAGNGTLPTSKSQNLTFKDFTLVDLSGDGQLDLVGWRSGNAVFDAGTGDGSFAAQVSSPLAAAPSDFALADFDGDGGLDMAVAGGSGNDVRILHGTAAGSFTQIADVPAGTSANVLAVADLDLDGLTDLVTLNQQALSRIFGTGGAQFAAPAVTSMTTSPTSLFVADVTGDGVPDLAVNDFVPNSFFSGLHLHPGVGDGSFGTGIPVAEPPGLRLQRAADVDDDGRLDLVLSSYFDHELGVLRVDPDGQPVFAGASWAGGYGGRQIATADLDGDGRPDVVAPSTEMSGPLRVWLHAPTTIATWTNLGHALGGVAGLPHLVGSGTLDAGSGGSLALSQARPSSLAVLFVSLSATPTSFKGGKLVAFPPVAMLPLLTTGGGGLTLPWSAWPAGLSGATLCFQFGIQDAAAVHGVALSNAEQRQVP